MISADGLRVIAIGNTLMIDLGRHNTNFSDNFELFVQLIDGSAQVSKGSIWGWVSNFAV